MKDGQYAVPSNVPAAQAIIRRLCELQADVMTVLDPSCDHATDCFCGEQGFWPLRTPDDYRNDGTAVDFIESVVRERLASLR